LKSHVCAQILCSDLYIICLQLLISYLGFYFGYRLTTLSGTLSYKITRIYEFTSFLSFFIYKQVPNNTLQICVTFIETNAFEIKFETSIFETKIPSRYPFRSTRFENRDTRIQGNRLFRLHYLSLVKLFLKIGPCIGRPPPPPNY